MDEVIAIGSYRNLLSLPREVLRHILSFIDVHELSQSTSATCQTFFDISHSILGGRFRFNGDGIKHSLSQKEIVQSISYLIIQQDDCNLVSTYEWLEATDDLSDEEKVVGTGIIGCSLSYDTVCQITECCSNLKYFYWFGNSSSYNNIKPKPRRVLLEDDKLLTRLPEILQRCSNLESIWCTNDQLNLGINSKCISNTPNVCPHTSKMKLLKLNNFDSSVAFALNRQYPDINSLAITGESISDHVLNNMIVGQRRIKNLSMSLSKYILSRTSIKEWFNDLSLDTLRLSRDSKFEKGDGNLNIDDIALMINNLKKLEIGKFITINEKTFITLVQNSPDLEGLVLKDQKFSVSAIISILSLCSNMKKLEFSDLQLVTDDVLRQISECCPQLVDLNINSKWKVTDNGFCDIVEKCVLLQKLDISGTRLTNKSFLRMAETLKCLEHLKMRQCDYLTDEAVSMIIHHCPNLLTLDIGWCSKLTKESLNAIAKYSKNLLYLSMPGLYEAVFSVETIANLLIKCQKLKYLNFLDYRDTLHTKLFREMLEKLFQDIKTTRSSFHVVIEEERGGCTSFIVPFSPLS